MLSTKKYEHVKGAIGPRLPHFSAAAQHRLTTRLVMSADGRTKSGRPAVVIYLHQGFGGQENTMAGWGLLHSKTLARERKYSAWYRFVPLGTAWYRLAGK